MKQQEYELQDSDGRVTQFTGVELANGSTDDGKSLRWTELSIFRTAGGQYVVHKRGRTLAYHQQPSESCGRHGTITLVSDAFKDRRAEQLVSCPVCQPPDLEDMPNGNHIRLEHDRSTVLVATNAQDAVDYCYTDVQGSRYLTKVARAALMQASRVDTDIHRAFTVQVVK